MPEAAMIYDAVIIGTGRVGLPLGLMLSHKGLKCVGIDRSKELAEKVNRKEMPFSEPGFETIIQNTGFHIENDFTLAGKSRNIIITVGTPILQHIETDLSQIINVTRSIIPHLRKGHNIILRSTVAPKTTLFVKNYIEEHTDFVVGKDVFLSFCPERLAEGKAYEELSSLPQIIGAEDDGSFEAAREVFAGFNTDILRTNYVGAELAKLFCNINRYVSFAVANQFALIADLFEQDIYHILNLTNKDYPRGTIPFPGFTAGTCLRKDFGMINETIPYTDILLSSWKINEYMPSFLVKNLLKRTAIKGKIVAVLGYTFKKDADDTRDSLVPKLLRYLEREVPHRVKVHEPHLKEKEIEGTYQNYSLKDALHGADIVYIAVNHSVFKRDKNIILSEVKGNCYFADLWNVFETDKIFFKRSDVL